MTDQTAPEPADDDDAGFQIVPGAELYLRLERRVHELEQLRRDLAAANARLERHRGELEQIKGALVQLVEYVKQTAPAGPAPIVKGDFL